LNASNKPASSLDIVANNVLEAGTPLPRRVAAPTFHVAKARTAPIRNASFFTLNFLYMEIGCVEHGETRKIVLGKKKKDLGAT
jgi:hypothetical protein